MEGFPTLVVCFRIRVWKPIQRRRHREGWKQDWEIIGANRSKREPKCLIAQRCGTICPASASRKGIGVAARWGLGCPQQAVLTRRRNSPRQNFGKDTPFQRLPPFPQPPTLSITGFISQTKAFSWPRACAKVYALLKTNMPARLPSKRLATSKEPTALEESPYRQADGPVTVAEAKAEGQVFDPAAYDAASSTCIALAQRISSATPP